MITDVGSSDRFLMSEGEKNPENTDARFNGRWDVRKVEYLKPRLGGRIFNVLRVFHSSSQFI